MGELRNAEHTLGKNTKGFYLTDGTGKDLFLTVTEPDYNKPKGTILYFHGTGEFSELMGNQISQWSRAGYRVVTYDQPGAGLSYKFSETGTEALLHMHSISEQGDAASRVVEAIQNKYRDTQNGRLHFVSNGTGSLVALDTVTRLGAGAVGSITQVSPMYDSDYSNIDFRFAIRTPGSTDIDRIEQNKGNYTVITGERLAAAETNFFTKIDSAGSRVVDPMHANRSHGKITEGYMKAVTNELDRINPQRDDLFYYGADDVKAVDVIKRNKINFAVVYDPGARLTGSSTDTTEEWLAHNSVPTDVTKLDGKGIDLIRNPDVSDRVLAAIEENIDGCLYVKVVNKLQKLGESDWKAEGAGSSVTGLTRGDRMDMQKSLESMGYNVGKYGIDGVPSFGQVADTEHALSQFLVTYLDHTGRDVDTFQYTPEKISELVREAKQMGFVKPDEKTLRTDKSYDEIQKNEELDHGRDSHHLVKGPAPVAVIRP